MSPKREHERLWCTVTEAAGSMGCTRQTAYNRFRALEAKSGKVLLVKRSRHGRRIFCVRRADVERAVRDCGAHVEEASLAHTLDLIESVAEYQEQILAELLRMRRERLSA